MVRRLFTGFVLLMSLMNGCSSDFASGEITGEARAVTLGRVLVTLKPPRDDTPDGVHMVAAAESLTEAFPGARVLRTMPAFSQLLIELPSSQMDALAAKPFVISVTPDASYRATDNK